MHVTCGRMSIACSSTVQHVTLQGELQHLDPHPMTCSSTVWHMALQHKPQYLDSVPILIPSPIAGSVPYEPGTEGQQLGVIQQHEGWRKGWILALLPGTNLADLFCTVTK